HHQPGGFGQAVAAAVYPGLINIAPARSEHIQIAGSISSCACSSNEHVRGAADEAKLVSIDAGASLNLIHVTDRKSVGNLLGDSLGTPTNNACPVKLTVRRFLKAVVGPPHGFTSAASLCEW